MNPIEDMHKELKNLYLPQNWRMIFYKRYRPIYFYNSVSCNSIYKRFEIVTSCLKSMFTYFNIYIYNLYQNMCFCKLKRKRKTIELCMHLHWLLKYEWYCWSLFCQHPCRKGYFVFFRCVGHAVCLFSCGHVCMYSLFRGILVARLVG